MSFQELFFQAMKRPLPSLLSYVSDGLAFDIGASGSHSYATPLGLPGWAFPRDPIPASDGSVSTLYVFHFLEHLSGVDAIHFLREAERVLMVGGVLNFCMPYYNSGLMAQDLTHRSFWNEESFRNLFDNHYYDPAGSWKLKVHFQIIAGIVERNLALIGQLVKES